MLKLIMVALTLLLPASLLAGSTAEEMAQQIVNLQNSPKMQNAIKEQAERIKQKGLVKKEIKEEFREQSGPGEDVTIPKPLILIFLSSSMPEELLIKFVDEGSKLTEQEAAKVIFLIRGYPKEGLKVFGRRINPGNHGIVLRVDPFLFGKLEIDTVPIVIVDRMYAVLHPSSLKSAINEIMEAGYEDLAQILAY